jgi:RND family efflux transporter MFP subunit
MKQTKSILITLPAVLLLSLLAGCSSSEQKSEKEISEVPVASVFVLKKEKPVSAIQLPGELAAFQQVDLYAKVTGFVKELKVDIGSEVAKGQLLLTLEAPELFSQMAASESRLKSQEATYAASNSNYQRLVETGKTPGTVSQNDLDLAEAKKNADQANLEAARAASKEIGVMKDYLEIRAPFNGIITSRNVNLGAYVGPSGKGSEFPLLTLQQQSQLRLIVSIPEAFTGYLKSEDEVSFKVRSSPGNVYKAKVKRLAGALDTRLRSERIEMDVVNSDKKLLPGTIAEVNLSLSSMDSSFVVPKAAVLTSGEGVYVIRVENSKAEKIEVKKGREINDQVEIFGLLNSGDVLLSKASDEIKNGTEIKLK